MEALLKAELGIEVFASIGGRSGAMAEMKAKLERRSSNRKRFVIMEFEEEIKLKEVKNHLETDLIVALRCRREAAESGWSGLSRLYGRRIQRECDRENAHSSRGGFVALSGQIAWCLGGWRSQRDVQEAASALVAEAKRRAIDGRRDFFVVRPRPIFGQDEMRSRLDHLFATIPDHHLLQLDEEAAYSVSNETAAAKVATLCATYRPNTIIDATACVGGNTIAFAKKFHTVFAFEIDQDKVAMLQHNLNHVRHHALSRKESFTQVQVLHGDCLDLLPRVLRNLSTPVLVFADPPWGGRNYKFQAHPDVHLKTSHTTSTTSTLDALLAIAAHHPLIRQLALKLPFNFDCEALVASIAPQLQSHQIHLLSSKVQLLILTFLSTSKSFLLEEPASTTTRRTMETKRLRSPSSLEEEKTKVNFPTTQTATDAHSIDFLSRHRHKKTKKRKRTKGGP